MDHSLLTAGRSTHVKIVIVALLGAIVVVSVGIAAHVGTPLPGAPAATVLKAGQPASFTERDGAFVR